MTEVIMTAPSDLERALDAYRHALLHHDEMGGCDPNDCEVWEDEKAAARAAVLSAVHHSGPKSKTSPWAI